MEERDLGNETGHRLIGAKPGFDYPLSTRSNRVNTEKGETLQALKSPWGNRRVRTGSGYCLIEGLE